MNWQDIKVSEDNTHFLFQNKKLFDKCFLEVLKFHDPGLAPVRDESGSYHIDKYGKQIYAYRYTRTFGFYCGRAAVMSTENCFHITVDGDRAYKEEYSWVGNFQENLCTVRAGNNYFHIDLKGRRIYSNNYLYCGDYKDGIACIKSFDGLYRHIDKSGCYINKKSFLDLGVFHKNFATAKDKSGWFHINKNGDEIYRQRYAAIEPFYNGFALVTEFESNKCIIDEQGVKIIGV